MLGVFGAVFRAAVQGLVWQDWSTLPLPIGRSAEPPTPTLCVAAMFLPPGTLVQPALPGRLCLIRVSFKHTGACKI